MDHIEDMMQNMHVARGYYFPTPVEEQVFYAPWDMPYCPPSNPEADLIHTREWNAPVPPRPKSVRNHCESPSKNTKRSTSTGNSKSIQPSCNLVDLKDLFGHYVEYSRDQHGSRFIQQQIELADAEGNQMVFHEVLPAAHSLMIDLFGNYVIQKFFVFGTDQQKLSLVEKLHGQVLSLTMNTYGCRVIQKAIETLPPTHQAEIIAELEGNILTCVKDQNGNHVIQKCFECVNPILLNLVILSFKGHVCELAVHTYGCRVIQRVLEHCNAEQTRLVLTELLENTEQLVLDQYGNYVMQHVLEHGRPEDRSKIIIDLQGKICTLSQHKFASNVIEKCLSHACRQERWGIIQEIIQQESALLVMMKDQYANYVVQRAIDCAEPSQRKILIYMIRPHLVHVRRYMYAKHIVTKVEKLILKSGAAGIYW